MPGLGQIALVKSHGFSSFLTSLVTRSPYTHMITYVGNDMVVSCEPSGVAQLPITAFPEATWSHFPLELQQTATIINFTRAQLGKPYDQLMYVWCGIARIFGVKVTPNWILKRLASHRAWICSQLADSAYQAAGIQLFPDGRAKGAVVPADFVPIFVKNGWL